MTDVAQVCDTDHHGARFSNTIVEELHEPTSTQLGVVGPVVDELGTETIGAGNTRDAVLGYDHIRESGEIGLPSSTPRFLNIGQHIIRVIEMEDPTEVWDIECHSQDRGRHYGTNFPCSELFQYGVDFTLGHMTMAEAESESSTGRHRVFP
jgi:hypothetical protein